MQGEVKPAVRMTPEGIRDFIGSHFDSLAFGAEDEKPNEGDRYTLTVHDLLSAFEWADRPVYTADQLRQAVQEAVEAEREVLAAAWEAAKGFDKHAVAEFIRSRGK